jgi:hypothetical protein
LVSSKNTSQNKFYKSLKSDLVVSCKKNHAKNKTLFASRLMACERYCRGILYKIGFKPIGFWIPRYEIISEKETLN